MEIRRCFHITHLLIAVVVLVSFLPLLWNMVVSAFYDGFRDLLITLVMAIGGCENRRSCNECVGISTTVHCYFVVFGENQFSCQNAFGVIFNNTHINDVISFYNPDSCSKVESFSLPFSSTTLQVYANGGAPYEWNFSLCSVIIMGISLFVYYVVYVLSAKLAHHFGEFLHRRLSADPQRRRETRWHLLRGAMSRNIES